MLDNVSLITDVCTIWLKKGGRVVPGAKSTIMQNQMQYFWEEYLVKRRGNKTYRIPGWQVDKKRDRSSIQTEEIRLKS